MGPIGIFDSGYGGLTVLKEIVGVLPQYDYLYLGDNARTPYGTRSFESVYEFTLEGVNYLFDQGCELIILACNTASAKALRTIQQENLPKMDSSKRVLGVIRPTTEQAGNFTKTGKLGLFGTNGTINSGSYLLEINKFFPDIKVIQEACPMWVPLVENHEIANEGAAYFVKQHVENLLSIEPEIDAILLACTHYPLLAEMIQKYAGTKVKLISQGPIVADRLKDYLNRHPEIESECSKNGKVSFLTTDDTIRFDQSASWFFGEEVNSKHIHL